MKLFKQFVQVFKGSRSNPETASQYVPSRSCDWREPLLIEAARKHGKPFKCAGDELPREIILGGRDLVVVGDETRKMEGSPRAILPRPKRVQSVLARLANSNVLRSSSPYQLDNSPEAVR